MQLFYQPGISGNSLYLDENESRHCIKVMRLEKGNLIRVVDGCGGMFETEITDPDHKRCGLKLVRCVKEFGRRDFYVHIAIAPTKNTDRIEWFAEKATEIGIDEITPVICANSERRVFNTDRVGKIVVSAMKQSIKAYLPKINPAISLNNLIGMPFDGLKLIAHCHTDSLVFMKEIVKKGENILILIGPEGDFTLNEVEGAIGKGFAEVSLGSSRLRTETAGILACHIVNLINE